MVLTSTYACRSPMLCDMGMLIESAAAILLVTNIDFRARTRSDQTSVTQNHRRTKNCMSPQPRSNVAENSRQNTAPGHLYRPGSSRRLPSARASQMPAGPWRWPQSTAQIQGRRGMPPEWLDAQIPVSERASGDISRPQDWKPHSQPQKTQYWQSQTMWG